MYKVIALSSVSCGKCDEAKHLLREYDIRWVDVYRELEGKTLAEEHGVKFLPFFLIRSTYGEVFTEQSYLKVLKILEEDKNK